MFLNLNDIPQDLQTCSLTSMIPPRIYYACSLTSMTPRLFLNLNDTPKDLLCLFLNLNDTLSNLHVPLRPNFAGSVLHFPLVQ